MHWFWRAMIAVLATCIYAGFAVTVLELANSRALTAIVSALGNSTLTRGWRLGFAVPLVYFLPAGIIAIAVYGGLTRRFAPRPDRETRCRKCGYILRGISEPRCPECGEPI